MHIHKFVFGPFAENTYVINDDTSECVIIDPGTSDESEFMQLKSFIQNHELKPVRLINTHCHIDHIMGNRSVYETWNLLPEYHEKESKILSAADGMAEAMGLNSPNSPLAENFLKEETTISFGNSSLKTVFTPGHSPGHLSLLAPDNSFMISGDVIFQGSIGRTDLPGGNYETLIKSILNMVMTLSDDCKLYPGHGPETTVGFERKSNPFVLAES